MSSLRPWILLAALAFLLAGCSPCAEDEAGMVELARRHLPLVEAETLPMATVRRVDRNGSSLLVIRAGGGEHKAVLFPRKL